MTLSVSRFGEWLALICILACVRTVPAQPPAAVGEARKPNVVLILADDMGFSDLGCYGGEIDTPNLDRLAASGLRLTQMSNAARCWPTRAVLLTGYYAPQVNRDPAGDRPAWAVLLPSLLEAAGYRSYHSGKWHIDSKPVKSGFHRSYWLNDYDRFFTPKKHFLDDEPLPPVTPDENYYSTVNIAQHAIDFLAEHQREHDNQPFFLYLPFLSPHFPLHALPEDIARYKGRYDEGWDVIRNRRWERLRALGIVDAELPPRDPKFTPRYWKDQVLEEIGPGEVKHALAWDSLTDEQKRLQAAKMEIHAAMVDRMDREIGRVLEQVRSMNAMDDTLVIFLSDNGADATLMVRGDRHDQAADPGSAASFLCLGPGWATASNAPFRRHKIWVHEGGIATPCILAWPKGIPAPASPAAAGDASTANLRRTPAHAIDIVPTILALASVAAPQKWNDHPRPPLPGRSLVPLFTADAPIERDELYWHHEGNRALRIGDFKLVSERENNGTWELYNLAADRTELHDLATAHPDRVRAMADRWQKLDATYRQQSGAPAPDAAGGRARKR